MAFLYGRAGRVTAKNCCFRPGQVTQLRKLCVSRSLGTKGTKTELVAKLLEEDEAMVFSWRRDGHRCAGEARTQSDKCHGRSAVTCGAWAYFFPAPFSFTWNPYRITSCPPRRWIGQRVLRNFPDYGDVSRGFSRDRRFALPFGPYRNFPYTSKREWGEEE